MYTNNNIEGKNSSTHTHIYILQNKNITNLQRSLTSPKVSTIQSSYLKLAGGVSVHSCYESVWGMKWKNGLAARGRIASDTAPRRDQRQEARKQARKIYKEKENIGMLRVMEDL